MTEFDEEAIALSPDGKLMAYQSDETGRTEVFVRPFPDVDAGTQQISSAGGVAPLWSKDGRELFFVSDDRQMMSARVIPGSRLAAPVPLFRLREALLGAEATWYTPWDVARDGRFIMARLVGSATEAGSGIVMVENWATEVRAKVKR